MKRGSPFLWIALVTLASCTSGDSTGPAVVDTVRISPESQSTPVGLSVQYSADPRDAGGAPITGLTATWASSDETVAQISTGGLATALKVGSTTITATVSGVSASTDLTVVASECSNRVDVVLNPGEYQTYDSGSCILLPSGSSGDRYRLTVIRPTTIENTADVSTVVVDANPVVSALAAPPQTAPSTAPERVSAAERMDGTQMLRDLALQAATSRYDVRLRERELRMGFGPRDLLPRAPALAPAPATPPSRRDLHLQLDCNDNTLSAALLVNYNDDLAIYQDSVSRDATPLSTGATQAMLDYYTTYAKSMTAQYWGDMPDTDANGRIVIVTSPSLADSVAAAVYSGDLVSTANCSSSNEGEFVYYSRKIIDQIDSMSFGALPTLAHEVKHVVSLYNGIARSSAAGVQKFDNIWIEEGQAEIAGYTSSRIAWAANGGPAVDAEATGTQIRNDWKNWQLLHPGGNIPPFLWGVIENVANAIVQLSTHPNSLITNPQGASPYHSFYAGSWHFHRFLGDAFGGAGDAPLGDADFFRTFNDSTSEGGVQGLVVATGGRTFEQLTEDLVVAMALTGTTAPQPSRTFTTLDMVSATGIFSSPPEFAPPGDYPWPVTTSDGTASAGFVAATYSGPVGPSGIRFYDFQSSGTGVGLQLTISSAPSGKVVVTRLK